jgi:hypothetical protein
MAPGDMKSGMSLDTAQTDQRRTSFTPVRRSISGVVRNFQALRLVIPQKSATDPSLRSRELEL